MDSNRHREKDCKHQSGKNSNSRILPISNKLVDMLDNLPRPNEKVFQTRVHGLRWTFESLRNQTAQKLGNPRLKQIHFHTFRHWKGTMEYHKTKDIIHVQHVLGHKDIESTMIYINIEQALFLDNDQQWTCRVSHNVNKSQQLIEAGFEYVTEQEGLNYTANANRHIPFFIVQLMPMVRARSRSRSQFLSSALVGV
jgi:hypothetical protein